MPELLRCVCVRACVRAHFQSCCCLGTEEWHGVGTFISVPNSFTTGMFIPLIPQCLTVGVNRHPL